MLEIIFICAALLLVAGESIPLRVLQPSGLSETPDDEEAGSSSPSETSDGQDAGSPESCGGKIWNKAAKFWGKTAKHRLYLGWCWFCLDVG